jgi:ABC-type bacteriocin/lantibiotic exporter with double-glycine peptidase domain
MNWFKQRGLSSTWGEEASIMLALPNLRQRDGWSCGPTCAAMVLQHFGKPVPKQFPSSSAIDGTDPLALVPIFRSANLHVLAGEMAYNDLAFQAGTMGRPVICLVQHDGVGHYVVVSGVRYRRVYYQCPVQGAESCGATEFLDRWFDQGRDCRYLQFGISVWRG